MSHDPSEIILICWFFFLSLWKTVVLLKGIVHPQNSVINYSSSCRSKPIRPSFISEYKLRCLWWSPRAFWPSIDSKATDTFKAQKGSKDIVMWHQWFNLNVMKLQECFLCTKKTKLLYSTISSLSCQSLMRSRQYHNSLTTFLGLERSVARRTIIIVFVP